MDKPILMKMSLLLWVEEFSVLYALQKMSRFATIWKLIDCNADRQAFDVISRSSKQISVSHLHLNSWQIYPNLVVTRN